MAKKPRHHKESGLLSKSQSDTIGAQMILPFVVTDDRLVKTFHNMLRQKAPVYKLDDEQNSDNKEYPEFRILVNVGWIPRETMEKINRFIHKESSREVPKQGFNNNNKDFDLVGVIRKTEKVCTLF